MGVMTCVRNGCDQTGCNTYIEDIGYICDSCIYEFRKHSGEKFLDEQHDEVFIRSILNDYLQTRASSYVKCTMNSFLERHRRKN